MKILPSYSRICVLRTARREGLGIALSTRRYFTKNGVELSPENLAMQKQINESKSNYFKSNRLEA